MNNWCVCIIKKSGRYYTGITTDLDQKIKDHNRERGCKYTAYRRPVALVYSEPYPDRSSAQKREVQIKGWIRKKKESLIRSTGAAPRR